MSLEQQIAALTAAIEANTLAILGNVPTAGTASTPATAAPFTSPAPAAAPVPSAPAAPATNVAAPATPPAAAPPAAASPSEVTLDHLRQEITAAYAAGTPEQQAAIANVIQGRYQLASIDAAPVDQYSNILAEVRNVCA